MKKIIFVSTGRCGTKKIHKLFENKSPYILTKHQMPFSRLANVVGNIMYTFRESEKIKDKLYSFIIGRYSSNKHFICTDPLTAMILPKRIILDENTMIVHIVRDKNGFAQSFYKITRNRLKSFMAHAFIPFWQVGILPLENILNKKIIDKYMELSDIKNIYFYNKYSMNANYRKVLMEDIFMTDVLSEIVESFLGEKIYFTTKELTEKINY